MTEDLLPLEVEWIAIRIAASEAVKQHKVTRFGVQFVDHFRNRRAIRFSIRLNDDVHRSRFPAVLDGNGRLARAHHLEDAMGVHRHDPFIG